ncbi:MAG: zinc-ribbon domain-containing protein [Anaerostipes hadrus]
MFCPNCGSEVKDDDLFCGECGAKIEHTEVPESEPVKKKRLHSQNQ